MPNKRPYFLGTDATTDVWPQQGDYPQGPRFINLAAVNPRTILGGDGGSYEVSDQTVSPRGSKNVIWSSEGYTFNGNTIAALSAAQKKVTGTHATNIGVAGALDFSPYRNLTLAINLTTFTGGTSIQFELD